MHFGNETLQHLPGQGIGLFQHIVLLPAVTDGDRAVVLLLRVFHNHLDLRDVELPDHQLVNKFLKDHLEPILDMVSQLVFPAIDADPAFRGGKVITLAVNDQFEDLQTPDKAARLFTLRVQENLLRRPFLINSALIM